MEMTKEWNFHDTNGTRINFRRWDLAREHDMYGSIIESIALSFQGCFAFVNRGERAGKSCEGLDFDVYNVSSMWITR